MWRVPQGSILGLILIDVFLCYMFFLVDSVYIADYADDTTPCTFGKNECEVESKLKMASIKLFKWFHENGIKANKISFISCLVLT